MICFINTAKTGGGGEKWHFDMAVGLKAAGVEVSAVVSPGSFLESKLHSAGVRTFSMKVGNLSFLNPLKLDLLEKFFTRMRVDIIITNLPADMKLAGSAAMKSAVKRIIYRRGSAIPVKNSIINRYYYSCVLTDIIANSEATKKTILANNPQLFPADEIKVIYNGIDFSGYPAVPETEISSDGIFRIGNLGRMVPQKAQTLLVDLSAELEKRHFPHRIIIGGDGPERVKVKNYAKEKKTYGNIDFPGIIEDVTAFMRGIDVFVLTSRWEGFGYVLTEAMACGKPALAFNLSSNPEIISDGETGFLVRSGDISALADKIIELKENDKLRRTIGGNAFRIVREKFSSERELAELKEFLGL